MCAHAETCADMCAHAETCADMCADMCAFTHLDPGKVILERVEHANKLFIADAVIAILPRVRVATGAIYIRTIHILVQ